MIYIFDYEVFAFDWLFVQEETFSKNIWECACGEGHLSKVLKAHGFKVLSTDLIDRGYGLKKLKEIDPSQEEFIQKIAIKEARCMANISDLSFEARRKKEKSKILKIYKDLSDDQKKIAEKMIDRAAYMVVTLTDMEEKIARDGLVVEMPQGEYTIERAHPLLQAYNSMVKNFNSTIKQLNELAPKQTAEKAGEALLKFATMRAAK